MGYEHVLDGCMRSSMELRRIRNARITAVRHRKWQEARLQREQEEKKAAEEVLNRRRRERARLATYIYSSAHYADKGLCNKSQTNVEHMSKNSTVLRNSRGIDDDSACKQKGRFQLYDQAILSSEGTSQKISIEKDIVLDVCSLPNIPINKNQCDSFLQICHEGVGQDKPEATMDFLQDALQERLENEAATSLLIAEITDMKSRLVDCLSKPSEDDFTPPKLRDLASGKGIQSCVDSNQEAIILPPYDSAKIAEKRQFTGKRDDGFEFKRIEAAPKSNEKTYNQSNGTLLIEKGVAESHGEGMVSFFKENRVENRAKCCMHADHEGCTVDSLGKDNVVLHMSNKANTETIICEQDRIMTEKAMAWEIVWRSEPKGYLAQKESKAKGIFSNERTCVAQSSMAVMGVVPTNVCDAFSCKDEDGEHKILQRVSGELSKQKDEDSFSASNGKELHEKTITTETGAGCKSTKERAIANVKLLQGPSCCSKPSFLHSASSLTATHKSPHAKQLSCFPLSSECKDNLILSCLKNRKVAARLLGLSDEEKSLLASIERLDVKLAMVSAKNSNSSRTSLISEGHQSTKSAPPVMKQKPGSDSFSVNSSMFPSRPTTSQTRGVSLASRRRQNVGLTNMSKERINQFQSCKLQQSRESQVLSLEFHDEGRQTSAGTILVHQNAEFLFS